jgi:dsRNA-specific ribonuclease
VAASLKSAKLAALHARLSLPRRFPVQTLARALVDVTADPNESFNNSSLATLGADILGNYMAEHLICHYPRIPMDVLFAAQEAYVGPKALTAMAKEWGVEYAAEPGGEVDPGILQFRRVQPGMDPTVAEDGSPIMDATGRNDKPGYRRGISSRIVYDDQFGDLKRPVPGVDNTLPVTTAQDASTNFVRALVGAIYLHTGRIATKKFFTNHFLSRTLNLSQLFDFRYPTRDLSRLCLREGFEAPVARLISETGRESAHPVFLVGVFSGLDKLGEAAGGSLDEARNRACTAALKGWYLYSPMDVVVPSEVEIGDPNGKWKANMVDPGEIVT